MSAYRRIESQKQMVQLHLAACIADAAFRHHLTAIQTYSHSPTKLHDALFALNTLWQDMWGLIYSSQFSMLHGSPFCDHQARELAHDSLCFVHAAMDELLPLRHSGFTKKQRMRAYQQASRALHHWPWFLVLTEQFIQSFPAHEDYVRPHPVLPKEF